MGQPKVIDSPPHVFGALARESPQRAWQAARIVREAAADFLPGGDFNRYHGKGPVERFIRPGDVNNGQEPQGLPGRQGHFYRGDASAFCAVSASMSPMSLVIMNLHVRPIMDGVVAEHQQRRKTRRQPHRSIGHQTVANSCRTVAGNLHSTGTLVSSVHLSSLKDSSVCTRCACAHTTCVELINQKYLLHA